jgi:hypothetical protein
VAGHPAPTLRIECLDIYIIILAARQGLFPCFGNPSEAVKKLKIAKFRFCRSLTTKGRIFIFVRKINFFTASQSRRVGTPRCGVRTAQRAVPPFPEPPSLTDYLFWKKGREWFFARGCELGRSCRGHGAKDSNRRVAPGAFSSRRPRRPSGRRALTTLSNLALFSTRDEKDAKICAHPH